MFRRAEPLQRWRKADRKGRPLSLRCSTPLALGAEWRLLTQGALRDPGLRCLTPLAFRGRNYADFLSILRRTSFVAQKSGAKAWAEVVQRIGLRPSVRVKLHTSRKCYVAEIGRKAESGKRKAGGNAAGRGFGFGLRKEWDMYNSIDQSVGFGRAFLNTRPVWGRGKGQR